jgi:hypothetical protein
VQTGCTAKSQLVTLRNEAVSGGAHLISAFLAPSRKSKGAQVLLTKRNMGQSLNPWRCVSVPNDHSAQAPGGACCRSRRRVASSHLCKIQFIFDPAATHAARYQWLVTGSIRDLTTALIPHNQDLRMPKWLCSTWCDKGRMQAEHNALHAYRQTR